MANSKSAEKRIRVNERKRLQNKYYKTSVRTLSKSFFINLESYKISQTSEMEKNLKQVLKS